MIATWGGLDIASHPVSVSEEQAVSDRMPRLSFIILLQITIERLLALLRGLPGFGPEAEVNAPPVGRGAAVQEGGDELVEIQVSLAERVGGAGLVAVQPAVRVDHMDRAHAALERGEHLVRAACRGL